jgi:hypothetical protein
MQIGWYGSGYALTREWGRAWRHRYSNYHVRIMKRDMKRNANRRHRRRMEQRIRAGDEDPFRRNKEYNVTGWCVY